MNGNNGNRARANKMEQAPTRHQPRRGVRNLANARAVAQMVAPRVSGPVRATRKVRMNQNKKPYARASKNKSNNALSLSGLSFGNSSFSMKRFNPKKFAPYHAPSYPSSGFVPQNAQQAFQARLNQNIAAQRASNQQRLSNIAARRSLGAKKAAATRKARKEAAEVALVGAMEDVQHAEQRVQQQAQSANGVSANAQRALANAQRAAQNADAALHRTLLEQNNDYNATLHAPNAASANNLSSMFGRL